MFSFFSSPDQTRTKILQMAISYQRERATDSTLESKDIESVMQTANTFSDFVFKPCAPSDPAVANALAALANMTQQNNQTSTSEKNITDVLLDMGRYIEQETTNGNIATETSEHLKEFVSSAIKAENDGNKQ